ncbi:hypothetical protein [Enterobacter quasiroggenkampii]|uniref:hypothetical protein n=1 Tax=Enterobacter quasiroggenkampii TaxID=2497436 RepID=UPI001F3DF171|nr:hypothetical protein [Enterobacter quasiroggenkampii]
MPLCNILLIGHGRDGESVHVEYDNSGILSFIQKTKMHAIGPDGEQRMAEHSLDDCNVFLVVTHHYAGNAYLIGTEGGELPRNINDRLRVENLEPSPFIE